MRKDPKAFRERFNAWKNGEQVYDAGRPITDALYEEKMKQVGRNNYVRWGFDTPEEATKAAMNDDSYDYRSFYENNPESTADSKTHWPDTYKTVFHPTFSNESIYSGKKNTKYNPYGLRGGMWVGDQFIPATWQGSPMNPKFMRLNKLGYSNGKDDEQNWFDEFRENHPVASTVASFLPVVGTTMDIYDAYKDPTAKNIGYATLSAATDLIGGRLIAKFAGQAIKRYKQFKKVSKITEKELSNWPYYKNMNPSEARRQIKIAAKERAEESVRDMAISSEYLPDASRFVVPAAIYTPDAIANINQSKERFTEYKDGKDGEIPSWANALIGASVADAPAVATASGWKNKDGKWIQKPTKETKQLANNLAILSTSSPTHPLNAAFTGAMNKLSLLANKSKAYYYSLNGAKLNKNTAKDFFNYVIQGDVAPAAYDYVPNRMMPTTKNIPESVKASIRNSTIPRMINQRRYMDPNDLKRSVEMSMNGSYAEFPEETYIAAGAGSRGGLYNPRKDYISVKQNTDLNRVLPHELRHRIDNFTGLTESEEAYLNKAFTSKFNQPDVEKVTTIGDIRRELLGSHIDTNMPWNNQNYVIDNLSDDKVIEAMRNANTYSKNYLQALVDEYGSVPQDVIRGMREAMKYVGISSAFNWLTGNRYNGFKKGKDSGIHIKPSHRGRLTALKKRTGKSEAELYKTGGPAVRKMITFARNARKWKH